MSPSDLGEILKPFVFLDLFDHEGAPFNGPLHPHSGIATLTRRFGDLDVAEESAAEAFAIAVARWPTDGIPANPGGWITTTANHKAVDRIRREWSVSWPPPKA